MTQAPAPKALPFLGGRLSRARLAILGLALALGAVACLALPGGSGLLLANEPAEGEPTFDAQALEFFEKEVRPLLVKRCYECHSGKSAEGGESAGPKGSLRVDSRAALLAGGDTGPAIVPGKPEESLLIDAINYGEIYQMPPKSRLPKAEIATLTRWVRMGAPWTPGTDTPAPLASKEFDIDERRKSHWAWQPVRAVEPPAVSQTGWPSDPLDHFILARLEAAGLQPAPRADKAALLRRASFDLIGLPPSPEELDAFLQDDSPEAFAQVVDRLLKSPHFGERWARHWLDLVRYAETYGHEFDYPVPHAAAYRDYVIRAFQQDVPYDQFVLEHLAGDLLPEPRRHPTEGFNESVIGTGFWWLGEATHAPVDVRGDEAGRIDNQLDVMSKTFLGLTVACARCHDHKFDAISTRDYYALAGFLQSSRRTEALLDPHERIEETVEKIESLRRRGDERLREALPSPADEAGRALAEGLLAAHRLRRARAAAAPGEAGPSKEASEEALLAKVAAEVEMPVERLRAWDQALRVAESKESREGASHPFGPWLELTAGSEFSAEAFARQRQKLLDDAARAEQSAAETPRVADFDGDDFGDWFSSGPAFGNRPTGSGEWDVTSESPRAVLPGQANSEATAGRLQGTLRSPTFELTHPNIFFRIRGQGVRLRVVIDGYFMDVYNGLLFRGLTNDVDTKGQTVWHRLAGDLGRYVGHTAYIEVLDQGDGFAVIDEIRFSAGAAPRMEAQPLARQVFQDEKVDSFVSLATAYGRVWRQVLERWHADQATADDVAWINWMLDHKLLATPSAEGMSLAERLAALRSEVQALQAELPAPQRVLAMTDGTAENEQVHIRGNHKALGDEVPRRLLEALEGEPIEEPGSGRLRLARQIADPDNPLTARVLVNRVWHHLFGRGIVASVDNFGVLGQPPTHPELLDHLAHRFVQEGWSVKRLLRAIMLSSTYQMSSVPREEAERKDPTNRLLHRARIRRLEGEAIRDAILAVSGRLDDRMFGGSVPVHITAFMQGRGRPGRNGPVDGAGRRSLYMEVRRNFLPPMMLAFDTPIPFSTMGRRNVSNVPAQALILMNDPFVVQQARVWAERVLQGADKEPRQRIAAMYREALTRDATTGELDAAEQFLGKQAQQYGLADEQARDDVRVWTDLAHVLFNVKEFTYLR